MKINKTHPASHLSSLPIRAFWGCGLLQLVCCLCNAGEIGDGCYVNEGSKPYVDFVRLTDAIYWAEGGRRTKFPYGIVSIKTRNAKHARQICYNSVSNSWKRWNGKGDFISFMSLRYCPVGEGNANWRKNVRWYYRNPKNVKH